jgi:hypothetical protein
MTKTYDDLSAMFLNCSLKPSREPSHTQKLMDVLKRPGFSGGS